MTTIQDVDWGLIRYEEAWDKQETLFADTIRCKQAKVSTKNHLIFCEHPHVYTLGKSGNEQNMLIDRIQLQAKKASLVHTNRGGDITYHGEGQLVGYPIFDLDNFHLGLKDYIYTLEEGIICLLKTYGVASSRMDGATGVWIDANKKSSRKICAIGVRASQHVTMHGFALNVNTQLEYFNYINPCGFVNKGVTSLQEELGKEINMEEVKHRLRVEIKRLFQSIV